MSLLHSPRIVTDRIVLNLDTANINSANNLSRNLALFSEDFSNAAWSKNNCSVVANQALALDGTLTADAVFESIDVFPDSHWISQTLSLGAGTYTHSAYVKIAGTDTFFNGVQITFAGGGANFNLNTGVRNFLFGTATAGTIENIGDGWWRVSTTCPIPTYGSWGILIQTSTAAGNTNYQGAGRSRLFVWGSQLELSSTPTEYFSVNSFPSSTSWRDTSGNNINGTLINSPVFSSSDRGYIWFNSTRNQRVDFSFDNRLLFLNRDPYTLEAWVYPTRNPGATSFTGIFDRESAATGSRDGFNLFFLGSAGTSTFWVTERFTAGVQTGPGGYTIDQSLSLNRWQHVVATYDGTNIRFYYNGSLISQGTSIGYISNSVAPFTIASRGGQPFDGRISVARVYSKALSDTEVTVNFNAMRTRYGL